MRIPGIEPDPERGTRIRESREARHWSQPEAAEAVGVSARTWWEWEQGGVISRPHLRVVASELRVSPEWLLTGEGQADGRRDGGGEREVIARLDEIAARLSRLEAQSDERLGALEAELRSLGSTLEEQLLAEPLPGEGDRQPGETAAPRPRTAPASGS